MCYSVFSEHISIQDFAPNSLLNLLNVCMYVCVSNWNTSTVLHSLCFKSCLSVGFVDFNMTFPVALQVHRAALTLHYDHHSVGMLDFLEAILKTNYYYFFNIPLIFLSCFPSESWKWEERGNRSGDKDMDQREKGEQKGIRRLKLEEDQV